MTRLDDERGKFSSPHKSFLPYQFPRSDVAILSRSFSFSFPFFPFLSTKVTQFAQVGILSGANDFVDGSRERDERVELHSNLKDPQPFHRAL